MTTSGERLARVQRAGQHAIDVLAAPLATDVEALVRSLAPFTITRQILLRNGLWGLLFGMEPILTAVIVAAAREAEAVADPAGPVDVVTLALVGQTTAESLAKYRPVIVTQAIRLVRRGVALGLTAVQTAQTVRQYVYRRDPATGLIQSWPGQAGMAMQHVRGLMQFESGSGHFRGMRRSAGRDGDLLRYTMSYQHSKGDECDQWARQDMGFGAGVYEPGDAPTVPRHFRCRCHYASATRPS